MQDISHLPRIIQTSDTHKAGKKKPKNKKKKEGGRDQKGIYFWF